MKYNYHNKQNSKRYSFYRIPGVLFTDSQFSKLSAEAKILYGLLLDRMSKSAEIDAENKAYIFFTLQEVQESLDIGKDKAIKLFNELDKGIGLIERKKQGQGKPTKIYVLDFADVKRSEKEEVTIKDKTEKLSNNANFNTSEVKTSKNLGTNFYADDNKNAEIRDIYKKQIHKSINYDVMVSKYRRGVINEIVDTVLDAICSEEDFVTIGFQRISRDKLATVFLRLKAEHIEYLIDCLRTVRNMGSQRTYILNKLYEKITKE